MLDYALHRCAIEKNKTVGDVADLSDLKPYIKTGTRLYADGVDVLGNAFGSQFSVDSPPSVPANSYAALSDVAPPEFWLPYK